MLKIASVYELIDIILKFIFEFLKFCHIFFKIAQDVGSFWKWISFWIDVIIQSFMNVSCASFLFIQVILLDRNSIYRTMKIVIIMSYIFSDDTTTFFFLKYC